MELDRQQFIQMLEAHDAVIAAMKADGLILCTDERERQRAKEVAAAVWSVFPEYLGCVSALFVYRRTEQKKQIFRDADGLTWFGEIDDGRERCAIGIAVEAMDIGGDYPLFVFMHELTHALGNGDHELPFQVRLNNMLREFNRKTGKRIENNYFGLPTRFDKKFHTDSRSYNPFAEDIPQETRSAQTRAFRTGGRPISGKDIE